MNKQNTHGYRYLYAKRELSPFETAEAKSK